MDDGVLKWVCHECQPTHGADFNLIILQPTAGGQHQYCFFLYFFFVSSSPLLPFVPCFPNSSPFFPISCLLFLLCFLLSFPPCFLLCFSPSFFLAPPPFFFLLLHPLLFLCLLLSFRFLSSSSSLFSPLLSSHLPISSPSVSPLSLPLSPLLLQWTATVTMKMTAPAPLTARKRSWSSLRSPCHVHRVFVPQTAASSRLGRSVWAEATNSADCRTRRRAARSRQTVKVCL